MELVATRAPKKTGMPDSGLILLVGNPKAGKTELALSFPDHYCLELEPGGADRQSGRIHDIADVVDEQGNVVKTALDVFGEAIDAAVHDDSVKQIIIDSVDWLDKLFEKDIAREKGIANFQERKEGVNGYALWAEKFERFEGLVGYLKGSGKLCILIAHLKDPKIEDGVYVAPAGINISGKANTYLAGQVDAIGHCYKMQVAGRTKHFVSFQGGPLGIWGSRIRELNDKVIELPAQKGYQAIAACFAAPAATTPAPAPARTKTKEKK